MALLSLITEQSTVPCFPTILLFLGDHFGVGIISGAVQFSLLMATLGHRTRERIFLVGFLSRSSDILSDSLRAGHDTL